MTRFLFVGDVMNVHVMCFYWRYTVIGDTLLLAIRCGWCRQRFYWLVICGGWLFVVAFVLFFKRLPQAFVLDFGHF